jgi:hypothetical protein
MPSLIGNSTKTKNLSTQYAAMQREKPSPFTVRPTTGADSHRRALERTLSRKCDVDLDSFVHELENAVQNQRQELKFCLRAVKRSVGTDLESIAAGLVERKRGLKVESGFNNLTAFYLVHAAKDLVI